MTISLMSHQHRGAVLMQSHRRYGLYMDPGCGKTITVYAGLRKSGLLPRTVVVCPLAVARTAWANDSAHFPDISVGIVAGKPPAERLRIIRSAPDVVAVNFETFPKHAAELLANGYTRLVVDESSKLKNCDTAITKAVLSYASKASHVYLLSGTPAPNGDSEYFAQLRCLSPEKTPSSPHTFWYRYFTPVTEQLNLRTGKRTVIKGWTPKDGERREEFLGLLKSCSWRLRKQDCLDLPEQTDMIRAVRLSGVEEAAYETARKELRAIVGDGADIRTVRLKAEGLVNKLRQLTGGWCYIDGEAHRYGTSKINELDDLLDELGDAPSLIWVDYREDARSVSELLHGRGADHRMLVGGGDDAAESVGEFQSGKIRHLVCHPASVGHGVTMTAAADAIYYSLPWSPELFQQSRDRIHRKGQTRACTYHYLLGEDTIDHRVLSVLRSKQRSSDMLSEILAGFGVQTDEKDVPSDGSETFTTCGVRACADEDGH